MPLEPFIPENPFTLLDFSDSHATPFRAIPRQPQYISQISLSHFGHAEADFEPMSLDSSPPRLYSFDDSVCDSLPNLPTRGSSSSTQVETADNTATGRFALARYRFYGSQGDCSRSLPAQGTVSQVVKPRPLAAAGGTNGFFTPSKTPGSLCLPLDHDYLGASPSSPGSLSRNSYRSALSYSNTGDLLLARTSSRPDGLDGSSSCVLEELEDGSSTVASLLLDGQPSDLDQDESFLWAREPPRGLWGNPSETHSEHSEHIAARNCYSPAPDSVVCEESLYDTLRGQLFEGADPWRALDDVLGLQPDQPPIVNGRIDVRDSRQEDEDVLAPEPDPDAASPTTQRERLEQGDYGSPDDVNRQRSAELDFEAPLDWGLLAGPDAAVGASTQDTVDLEGPLYSSLADSLSVSLVSQSMVAEECATHGQGLFATDGNVTCLDEAAVSGEWMGMFTPSQARRRQVHTDADCPSEDLPDLGVGIQVQSPAACPPPTDLCMQAQYIQDEFQSQDPHTIQETDSVAPPSMEEGEIAVAHPVTVEGPCLFTDDFVSEEE